MSTFESDGFLSTEMPRFEQEIAGRYANKLNLAEETNRIMHRIIYAVKPRNDRLPDLMLATLLSREASSFQAFIILLRKGLVTQAQVILRHLAEMMFITGAIRKDESFVDRYVESEEISRVKMLGAIVRDKQRRGEEADQETHQLIEEIRSKIDREKLTAFTTERIAEIAELSSYYDNLYRLTSMAVHASPRELSAALDIDSDGDIVSVSYEPMINDLDLYLDYGVSIMLFVLHEVASHFGLGIVPAIEDLQQSNRDLAGPAS